MPHSFPRNRLFPRNHLSLAALAPLFVVAAVNAAEPPYQQLPLELSAADVLPEALLSGEGYRVDPKVSNDGALNTYTIHSDYGTFTITSTDRLRARLQEIRATAALAELEQSEEFKEAAKQGVTGMYEGGKALVQEPVETTKNAARGVGRWLRNVGNSITSDDPHQDNVFETVVGYDTAKRAYALQMNVDPYTDFEPFQEHLSEVAKAATAGGLVTRAAVQVSTAGTVAGTVANVTSLAKMKDLVRDNPPATLEGINRQKLLDMGIEEYRADALLKNYNYTPVEMTIVCEALNRMGDIEGREVLVSLASAAPDREVASFMTYNVEMIANYMDTVEAANIIGVGSNPWLVTESGQLVGIFPLDYLAWTGETGRGLAFAPEKMKELGVKQKRLMVQGEFSPEARQVLESRGWQLTENVDLKPATAQEINEEVAG